MWNSSQWTLYNKMALNSSDKYIPFQSVASQLRKFSSWIKTISQYFLHIS
jgi:hypothetical protein